MVHDKLDGPKKNKKVSDWDDQDDDEYMDVKYDHDDEWDNYGDYDESYDYDSYDEYL